MFKNKNKGFTLVELLVVMGITVVLGGVAMSNYFNYQSSVTLDGAAEELLGTLRDAQQRAISQDQQSAWGVYISTSDGENDYYEPYSGDSRVAGTPLSRITLAEGLVFLVPSQGINKEIHFAKSTGLPNANHTITIASARDNSLARTIQISAGTGFISSFEGLSDAPVVSSVVPNFALNTGAVNITNISGSKFQADATVKFVKNGQTIVCTSVVVVSDIKLTATCDITSAAVGAWDVVVTNPDEQTGTLASGFAVNNQGGNVSGYAWSDNEGWISFGCSNDSSCNTVEYGVDIDGTTGLFSGYAWSDNVGWISFNTSDLTGCPSGACEARVTGGFTGTFPKSVTGWAKALSLAGEAGGGFISLHGTAPDYGIQLADDGNFSGYAWAPDMIGWISFNGANPYYQVSVLSDGFVVGGTTVPGSPTIGTATAGNAQATVAFTAPASNGGSPITGYTATSNPGGLTATGASSPITVTGLTNGTAYTFTVTATNAIGTGSASGSSNSVTPTTGVTVPGAPTIGTATAGNAQASVAFTAPVSNGGSAIIDYTATSNPGGLTSTSASSPITVTGLTNGTAYTFTVTARNSVGTGPASSASNSVTPSAPVWTCGNAFTDSRDSKSYSTVLIGTQCWMSQNMNVGTYIAGSTSQTNNSVIEKYCFDNTTANCDANGGLYQWNEAMQYSGVAESQGICPTGWHIPTHNEFTTLERTVCTSGTCLTDFPYDTTTTSYRGTNEGTKLKTGGSSGFNAQFGGYFADGTFSYQPSHIKIWTSFDNTGYPWVRAMYSSLAIVERGHHPREYAFSIRCIKDSTATVPGAPTIGTATAGNAQASVTFTAPASDGGSPITGYTVTSNPGGLTGTGSASPVTVTGLTNGTAYTFTVTATNDVGTGSASAASNSVTPFVIAIGASYQGGVIAYILQSGDPGYTAGESRGLIAAPSDQGSGITWGCRGTVIAGADGTAIGTGNQNTMDIMNGCSTAGIAARLCGDLSLGGYTDWYLPSRDELNKLYLNRTAIGNFSYDDVFGNYASSSESEDAGQSAWGQYFMNGEQHQYSSKDNQTHVRAVRMFSGNIVFPTVTAISPASAASMTSIALTSITGTGFASGATVKLTKAGQSDIACTGITVASATSITGGSCPITGAAAGVWNVVVTNSDTGSGALTGGFTILDYKRVFVTSTTYTGNLGGLAGADAKCAARATAASLTGTWKAWISSGATDITDARDRLTHSSSSYVNMHGDKIADNWADLVDGSLDAGITYNELGGTGGYGAWTGSNSDGTHYFSQDCSSTGAGWTVTTGTGGDAGLIGVIASATGSWSNSSGTSSCNSSLPIYCFEQ